jgi:hypothetical protein
MSKQIIIADEVVVNKIYHIRGLKVMIDRDLAELYGVETRTLIQAMKRNRKNFPDDFMFQLTTKEFQNLISQIVTSSWGGTRKLPFVFTEHGVLMLSSVLKNDRAIQVNIQIMRVYTRMKELLLTHKDIILKIEQLEKKLMKQDRKNKKYDEQMQLLFAYLKELLPKQNEPMRRMGYRRKDEE